MSRESWFRRLGRPLAASALAIVVALGVTRSRDAALPPPPSALGSASATVPAAPAAPPVSAAASVPRDIGAGNAAAPGPDATPDVVAAPAPEERPVRRFTITVMDDAKTPVAKATVHVHHGFDATTSIYRESAVADTDDSGVARFSVPVAGAHVVLRAERGTLAGWSDKLPIGVEEHVDHAIYVGPAISFSGRVCEASPQSRRTRGVGPGFDTADAVPDATVVMVVPATGTDAWRSAELVRFGVAVGGLGTFTTPPVRVDEGSKPSDTSSWVRFEIFAPGFADGFEAWIPGVPNGGHLGTVLLARARAVRGRVVYLSGKPAVRASVAVDGTNISAFTSSKGEFELTHAPFTALRVRVRAPWGPWERIVRAPPGDAADLGVIELGAAAPVTGRVFDAAGDPVPNADVFVLQAGADLHRPSVRTNKDGRFTLRNAPLGDIVLYATFREARDGFLVRTALVEVRGGAADVDLRIPPPATLSLTVVDDRTGKPISPAAVTVIIHRRPDEDAPGETDLRAALFDERNHSVEVEITESPVQVPHRVLGPANVVVMSKARKPARRFLGRSEVVEFRSGQTTEVRVEVEVWGD